jgi:hypothetical protein
LALSHYSIQNTERFEILCYKFNKQQLHSLIIKIENKNTVPVLFFIYFIQDRQEQKRLSDIPWHDMVFCKILNIHFVSSTFQVCQKTKKEHTSKECGLVPPKIAESDIRFLRHGLCRSGWSIYIKDTSQNTLSACTHNDRSINQHRLVWNFKIHKKVSPPRICFITPDCNVTHILRCDLKLVWLKCHNCNIKNLVEVKFKFTPIFKDNKLGGG